MAAATEKDILVRNVLRALRAHFQAPELASAQAVTKLVNLGMKTGNAQRLLDDTSSPRLQSIAQAARLLHVSLASLLTADDTDAEHTFHGEWPMMRISPEVWRSLGEREKGAIEDAAVAKLRDLRAESDAHRAKRSDAA